ncbi:MAG: competence protein TfoX [Alphaproteobacteria bacterium]|nr:competence protein TfoX [Alphaproteobacteria bacterium]
MTVSAGYIDFVKDLFAPFGEITVRRMFGGAGVYCDGRIFAIIGDDDLWFKTDEETRSAFLAAGLPPFTYETKDGEKGVMNYYAPPDDILDDAEALRRWTGLALAAATRGPKPKKKSVSGKNTKAPATSAQKAVKRPIVRRRTVRRKAARSS